MNPPTKREIDELGDHVVVLKSALNQIEKDLRIVASEQGITGTLFKFRDMQGRYIFADAYAAYTNAYSAWLMLRSRFDE